MNWAVVDRSWDTCGYCFNGHEQHAQDLCGYCWNCHEQHAPNYVIVYTSIDKPICSVLETEVYSKFLPRLC